MTNQDTASPETTLRIATDQLDIARAALSGAGVELIRDSNIGGESEADRQTLPPLSLAEAKRMGIDNKKAAYFWTKLVDFVQHDIVTNNVPVRLWEEAHRWIRPRVSQEEAGQQIAYLEKSGVTVYPQAKGEFTSFYIKPSEEISPLEVFLVPNGVKPDRLSAHDFILLADNLDRAGKLAGGLDRFMAPATAGYFEEVIKHLSS